MAKPNVEKLMNEWWDKKHKDDIRCSGDFSWDEIAEFGRFLIKKLKLKSEKKYE